MLRYDPLRTQWVEEPLIAPPPPRMRRRLGWFFVLFLLSQILIPLTYYLHNDPTGERFAWRMFSTIHMSRWQCQVTETVRTSNGLQQYVLPLEAMLQESTVATLHAGQLDYAQKLLQLRMQRPEVQKVEYEVHGLLPSGKPMKPIRLALVREASQIRQLRGSSP